VKSGMMQNLKNVSVDLKNICEFGSISHSTVLTPKNMFLENAVLQ
jgi:hypothetical protein